MKRAVIYHGECADGFGAAFAAWLKFGDDAVYIPCLYDKVKTVADLNSLLALYGVPDPDREVELYILDFGFSKGIMNWLFERMGRVVWLDHHKSSFETWCGKYEKGMHYFPQNIGSSPRIAIRLNDNKSGAYLAWEYFHPGAEVPMFILHIDDYDRWQFKMEGTKAFQRALWSYAPWSFEGWQNLLGKFYNGNLVGFWESAESGPLRDLIVEGAAILRAHDQQVAAVLESATTKCVIKQPSFKGQNCEDTNYPYYEHTGLAANSPKHLHSDVGHELAKKSGTFGLCWCLESNGRVKCGIRSASDYDVQAIAKALGGGGHARASGFYTDIDTLMRWLKPESK